MVARAISANPTLRSGGAPDADFAAHDLQVLRGAFEGVARSTMSALSRTLIAGAMGGRATMEHRLAAVEAAEPEARSRRCRRW